MDGDITVLSVVRLHPEEIPEALCRVSTEEAAGRLSPGEADAWRLWLSAWYGYRSLYRADRRRSGRILVETSAPRSRGAA